MVTRSKTLFDREHFDKWYGMLECRHWVTPETMAELVQCVTKVYTLMYKKVDEATDARNWERTDGSVEP